MIQKELKCDVLVIGSGGAGLRAAVEASKEGCSVILVSKGKVNRSGATLLAGANVSADLMADGGSLAKLGFTSADQNDTKEKWYEDIIHEGFYLNNRELVQLYVDMAPQVIKELIDAGAKVTDVEEGGRQIGMAGSEILNALYRMIKAEKITILEDTALCNLLPAENGTAAGALLLDIPHGNIISVEAKATIIATGGMHNCYTFNSGTSGLCGEGHAAAIKIGAEMTLMEMVTFCCNVMIAPQRFKGNILPYILQCIGYGRLTNGKGEDFLGKYLSPSAVDLALNSEWNKLLLSYAMYKETEAGLGDQNNGIRFDITYLSKEERDALEKLVPQLGKGIYKEIMALHDKEKSLSIHAAGHYFDGGIKVDVNMATSVPGLYAAGECAGGLFGANRVGAATTQMLVMGAQAGKHAAIYAKNADTPHADTAKTKALCCDILAPFAGTEGTSPRALRKQTAEVITKGAGIVRNKESLEQGLQDLAKIKDTPILFREKGRVMNREWLDYLETRSMVLCGEAIMKSSLLREESRGVFIRSDYMETDNDNGLYETIYQNGNVMKKDVPQKDITATGKSDFFESIEQVIARLSYS